MKTIALGKSALQTSRLAYGCWRIGGTQNSAEVSGERVAAGEAAVIAAYEAGYTLFDNADVYCGGAAEAIFGQAVREVGGMRDRILVITKCGIRKPGEPDASAPYRYDFTGDYIVSCAEQSLSRMHLDCIDLFLLHRPDWLCEPEEVARAFSQLKAAGKVREFGVSNFRPSQVVALQQACPMPLVANQVEVSLSCLEPFQDGSLDHCLTEKITPLAWSPLGGGRLASNAPIDMKDPHHARRHKLRDTMDLVARERGVSRSVIALAWLLRHPSRMVPIVGTTNPERVREAAQADALELSREEWYRLLEAALGQRLP